MTSTTLSTNSASAATAAAAAAAMDTSHNFATTSETWEERSWKRRRLDCGERQDVAMETDGGMDDDGSCTPAANQMETAPLPSTTSATSTTTLVQQQPQAPRKPPVEYCYYCSCYYCACRVVALGSNRVFTSA